MNDRQTDWQILAIGKKESFTFKQKKIIIKSRPKMPLNGLAALKEVA